MICASLLFLVLLPSYTLIYQPPSLSLSLFLCVSHNPTHTPPLTRTLALHAKLQSDGQSCIQMVRFMALQLAADVKQVLPEPHSRAAHPRFPTASLVLVRVVNECTGQRTLCSFSDFFFFLNTDQRPGETAPDSFQ